MAPTINQRDFPDSHDFDCPKCHNHITVYDPYNSVYVVCNSCNSYCRVIQQDHLQVQQPLSPLAYDPVIELGKQGVIKDSTYRVIAYMEKKEAGNDYEWREYILYNFKKGYAFLAEYDGHWSFIAGAGHFPEELKNVSVDGTVATLGEAEYLEYNEYTPVIKALVGEFDWDAYEERVHAREFINPRWLLVSERNKSSQSVDWYLGEYIEPAEIAAAFNVPMENFPEKADIGANQPNPYKKWWWQTLRISFGAAVLMVAIQVIFGIVRPGQLIMNNDVTLNLSVNAEKDIAKGDSLRRDSVRRDSLHLDSVLKDTANHYAQTHPSAYTSNNYSVPYPIAGNGNFEFQPVRTSAFVINHGPAPVDVEINAPVDNNWFEATVELVNEADNHTWDATKEVEYYHGYDDGDSWSEGSTDGSITIENVPPGKYHINIYAYGGTSMLNSVNVKVTANVILWQNILITLLVLCLAPLAFWYFQRRFEVNRWLNSDFSPYKKTSGND